MLWKFFSNGNKIQDFIEKFSHQRIYLNVIEDQPYKFQQSLQIIADIELNKIEFYSIF